MKLYVVKGYRTNKKDDDSYKRVDSFVGYFSNLKEIYLKFDKQSVSSYSTIAKTMKAKGIYKTFDSKFHIEDRVKRYLEISIIRIETNKIYSQSKFINLKKLLGEEVSDFNFERQISQRNGA